MLEIARNLENLARGLKPAWLIGFGLAALSLGLFVWLGGLGFRKLLVLVVGAVAGGACGFFFSGRSIPPTLVSTAIGAVVALIIERAFITLLAAAMAAAGGFIILTVIYKAGLEQGFVRALAKLPTHGWVLPAALALILLVAGTYLWRLTSALCCAVLGTLLIFTGMTLLLVHKGAVPVAHICTRPAYYAVVSAAMIAFGTVEQLLLCPGKRRPPAREKKPDKDEQDHCPPRRRWWAN
ncbi:MAG: hypothetical protein ACYS76_12095 [Planctomycetota bacterium]|jgi:hypothetical protein